MIEDNIVIVIDLGQYKEGYKENTPFKAKVVDKNQKEIIVKSLTTEKEYSLYYYQILEYIHDSVLKNVIDLRFTTIYRRTGTREDLLEKIKFLEKINDENGVEGLKKILRLYE